MQHHICTQSRQALGAHHAIFGCDKLGCEADGRADVVLRDGVFFRDDLERRSCCKLVEQHGNRYAGADVARFLGLGTSAMNRLAVGAQAVGLEDVIKRVLEPTSPSLGKRPLEKTV